MAEVKTSIIIEAVDKFSQSIGGMTGKLEGFQSKLERSADASRTFALGLAGVGTAVGGLAFATVKSASEFEQTMISFQTMLGSAEKAAIFVADMKKFAAKTPFETQDIAKAAQTMLAFGIDVKKVMPSVQMIGDVALGNKEKFNSLSLAFSQVMSTGKLMGQDLLQMINQGFNPLQIISEKTGESMAALKDKMSEGAISAEMVAEAFSIATSEGGRFYGGMEAQSQTLSGVWSTLTDTINEALIQLGDKFLPTLNSMIVKLTGFVENTLPQWIEKMSEITKWLGEHKTAIYIVAGALAGALAPAVLSAAASFAALAVTLAPWMIGGAIIAGVVTGIIWIVKNWEMIQEKASQIWSAIAAFFVEIWNQITAPFRTAINFIIGLIDWGFGLVGTDLLTYMTAYQETVQVAWDWITEKTKVFIGWLTGFFTASGEILNAVWNAVWEPIKNIGGEALGWLKDKIQDFVSWFTDKLGWITSAYNKISSMAGKVGSSVKSFVSNTISTGASITGFAEGGIVTRPTLAMIGEAGESEAVIPLSKLGQFGGSGITINIGTVNGVSRSIANDFASEIAKEIKRQIRI